jgi:pimeloyl-ACP methyl ester carboxylesterase
MPKATVNGINIYYEVHGQGDPFVLIMGSFGSLEAWALQIGAFQEHYKVIVFDNRGIGRTDKSPEPYSIATMADDTVGLLDHLGIDKAHVLGMSLGGPVAQDVAINYPHRVNKLILVCSMAGAEGTHLHPDMLRALGIENSSQRVDFRKVDFVQIMTATVALAFNDRSLGDSLAAQSETWFKQFDIEGFIHQWEAVASYNALDRLHKIRARALVITGTEDRLVDPRSSEMIAGLIPNSKLVKIEGGSHAFFMEMSDIFNAKVLDFLKAD